MKNNTIKISQSKQITNHNTIKYFKNPFCIMLSKNKAPLPKQNIKR